MISEVDRWDAEQVWKGLEPRIKRVLIKEFVDKFEEHTSEDVSDMIGDIIHDLTLCQRMQLTLGEKEKIINKMI